MTMTNARRQLPPVPNPDNLRKQAKMRLSALRMRQSSVRLGEAQHLLAREYGFPTWAAMLAEVTRRQDSLAGRYTRIRKLSVAVPGAPAEEEPHPVQRLFFAGAGAAAAFAIVACLGLAPVLLAIGQGLPFHGPAALGLLKHLR
jgi:hypothetical protein